jgi:hypothetical protein
MLTAPAPSTAPPPAQAPLISGVQNLNVQPSAALPAPISASTMGQSSLSSLSRSTGIQKPSVAPEVLGKSSALLAFIPAVGPVLSGLAAVGSVIATFFGMSEAESAQKRAETEEKRRYEEE